MNRTTALMPSDVHFSLSVGNQNSNAQLASLGSAAFRTRTLVIIDTIVDDYQQLVSGVVPGVTVILLRADQDGVMQITTALKAMPEITQVHIVAHGSPGCIHLGNTCLSVETLERYAFLLQHWFTPVVPAHPPALFLYSCNVAAGTLGAAFLQRLHNLTGASIAASQKPVGNVALGGGWQLETILGDIDPQPIFAASVLQQYSSILAEPANDAFSSAFSAPFILPSDFLVTVTGTNVGATADIPNEIRHGDILGSSYENLYGYPEGTFNNSVWWSWTAPDDGPVQIDTIGSDFDTTMGVYEGTGLQSLTVIDEQDLAGPAKINFTAVKGHTYLIAVDGAGAATGNIQLNIKQESSSAIQLVGDYIQLPVDDAQLNQGRFMLPTSVGGYTNGVAGQGGAKYNGVDCWDYGQAIYNYTIAVAGTTWTNGNGWAIAPTVTDQTSGSLNQVVITGSPIAGLIFTRIVSFLDTDKIVTIQDTFTNISGTAFTQVATLDNVDPDQGYALGATTATKNDVITGSNLVLAAADSATDYTIGFGSPDSAVHVTSEGLENLDPYSILSSSADPDGALGDIAINLAVDYGTVQAGQTITKSWYMVFGDTQQAATNTYTATVAALVPMVTSVTFSSLTLAEANTGQNFTITVVYDKTMDTSINPAIAFPTPGEDPLGTLSPVSGLWIDSKTFVATYQVTDVDANLPNIDVQISGAKSQGVLQILADYRNAFSIDTLAPVAPPAPALASASDTGVPDDKITASNRPTISGTGEVGTTIQLFETINNNHVSAGTTTVKFDGTWSLPTAGTLGDGAHTFIVRAKDAAGNTSGFSAPLTITVDTSAPQSPTLTLSPSSDSGPRDNVTNLPQPSFTGTTEAGTQVELFEGAVLLGSTTATADGTWTITPTNPLENRVYNLTAKATDVAGNVSNLSSGLSVTIDALAPTPPTLTLSSDSGVSATDRITNVNLPTFSGTTEAGTILDLFEGGVLLGSTSATGGGTWTITLTSALENRTYNLTAKATDSAGNVSDLSSVLAVTIDAIAPIKPTLTLSSDSGVSSTDRITNVLLPTFTGSTEAGTKVELYEGNVLLGSTTATSGGTWTINLTTPLQNRDYTLTAKATDVAGNVSQNSTALTVTIDALPPAQPTLILSPGSDSGAPDNVTNINTPTFSGNAEAGSKVELYEGAVLLGSATATPAGTWSITTNILENRDYTLITKATDVAGNVSQDSALLTVTIDAIAPNKPTLTLDPASDSGAADGITKFTQPVFTGNADAGVTVQLLEGTVVLGTATANNAGVWTMTPTAAMQNRSYNLIARAMDAAGNLSPDSTGLTVTIDAIAPSQPTLSLSPGSDSAATDNITNVTQPTFMGLAEVGSQVNLYEDNVLLGSTTASNAGIWSIALGTPLQNRAYTLTAKATDLAGNVSLASTALTVTIDAIAPSQPTLSLSPASDSGVADNITNINQPTFTGNAEIGAKVELWEGTVLLGSTTANNSGIWSITTGTLENRAYTLVAKSSDTAGNASPTSTSLTVTIDAQLPTQPTLTLNPISDSAALDGITKISQPTFTGNAEVGTRVELWEGTVLLGSTTANTLGNWTFTPATPLQNRSYTLIARSQDTAGNTSVDSAPLTVTIDPIAPNQPTLSLSPSSDSGAADGITNINTPTFTGTAEVGSTVKLYEGTVLLGSAIANTSGDWSIVVNPLDNRAYTLFITATDVAGNVSADSTALTVTIDASMPSSPTLNLSPTSDSAAADLITNVTTPTFTGGAEAGSTVRLYENSTLLGTATANNSGVWSITTGTLANRSYTLIVRSTDTAGNISPDSAPLTVTIDAIAPIQPTLTLDPASDSGVADRITSINQPTFTGNAEAGTTVQLFENDTLLGAVTTNQSGVWSITTNTLANRSYTLIAKSIDPAGNISPDSASLTVTIDAIAPNIPTLTLSPASDSAAIDNVTNITTPTFTGTAEAGATVKLYENSAVLGTATANNSGVWSITTGTLQNRSYTLTVQSTDTAGNVSNPSAPLTVTIDSVAPNAPTLTLNPASDSGAADLLTKITTPTFTGVAEAGATVQLLENTTLLGTAIADGAGNWSITTNTLQNRGYTLVAKALDTAGNASGTSTPLTITVDAIAPTIIVDPLITKDTTPRLTGTVNDPNATINVTVNGTNYAAINNGDGIWILTDGTISTALADNLYSVTATATDVAGNVGTDSSDNELTVNTKAPVVTINACQTTDRTPSLNGTVNHSTAAIGVTVRGVTYQATNHGNGTWSLADNVIASLTDGTYDVTVTATDALGNVGVDATSLDLVVDGTAPNVTIDPLNTGDNTPALSGTVDDPTAAIAVKLNGGTYTAINFGNGLWSLPNDTLAAQPNGVYNVVVEATDPMGNKGSDATVNELAIDNSPLTVDVVDVTPDPRSSSVNDISLSFSKVVNGFDLADLMLTRNGVPVALAGAMLTTVDQTNWTLTNLSSLTTDPGTYNLTVNASGSAIVDLFGNSLAANATDSWETEGETATAPAAINFTGGKTGVTRRGTGAANTLSGGSARDILKGAGGNDSLNGKGGVDRLYGDSGNDRLAGAGGNDQLIGGAGNDTLNGGAGNDLLNGGAGIDTLLGSDGDDVLIGGTSADTLTGGAGKDVFTFNSLTEAGDRITDFGSTDLMDLRSIFAGANYSGSSNYRRFTQFVQLAQVGSNTEVRIDADGSGGGTTFTTLATLNNVSAMTVTCRQFIIA